MKTTVEQKTIKAAIYVRVSTDEQAQYGYSVEAQKEKLLAFCKSQDWEVYKAYVDDGFRATTLNRPEIQKLIEESNHQKFNMVVFYKLDRLSRSVKDLNYLIEAFEKNNVAIKSITEPFDTSSPPGKLMFNMLGSFAQFERELIGERTKLGLYRAFDEGKWITTPPYGYNIKDGQLVLNDKEAIFVKRAIELCLVGNLGIGAIAKLLKEEDKITRRAGKWAKNSVWNLLHNPVYCGMALWKEELRKRNHQPIITKEEFDCIQERLHEKYLIPPHTNCSRNFLLGIIECGKCGAKLKVSVAKHKYRYYACTGRENGCDLPYISANAIEEVVLDEIRKSAADKKVIERCIKELRQNTAEEIKTLKKELTFLKRQLQESSDKKEKTLSWLANMLPEKNVTGRVEMEVEQLNVQIEKLKLAITETEAKFNQIEIGEVRIELIASFLEDFLNSFKEWDVKQRKLMIRLVVDKAIVYSKDKLKITLSIPLPKNKKLISLPAKKGTAAPCACGTDSTFVPAVPIFALSGVANGDRTRSKRATVSRATITP